MIRPNKLWWKLWLAMMVVLAICSNIFDYVAFSEEYLAEESIELTDIFDFLSMLTLFIGVVGYCFEYKIITEAFWKGALVLILIYDGYFLIETILLIREEYLNEILVVYLMLLLVFLVVLLPGYIALYKYSTKSKIIWHGKQKA